MGRAKRAQYAKLAFLLAVTAAGAALVLAAAWYACLAVMLTWRLPVWIETFPPTSLRHVALSVSNNLMRREGRAALPGLRRTAVRGRRLTKRRGPPRPSSYCQESGLPGQGRPLCYMGDRQAFGAISPAACKAFLLTAGPISS